MRAAFLAVGGLVEHRLKHVDVVAGTCSSAGLFSAVFRCAHARQHLAEVVVRVDDRRNTLVIGEKLVKGDDTVALVAGGALKGG